MPDSKIGIQNIEHIGELEDDLGKPTSVIGVAELDDKSGYVAVIGIANAPEMMGMATFIIKAQALRLLMEDMGKALVRLYELEAKGPPDE